MADFESPVKGLNEEATCPLCLDYFKDPVITVCGHNFCQACITKWWGVSSGEVTCPQCREIIQQRTLRPNRRLANVAELVQKLQEGKEEEEKKGVCKLHQEPLKLFCKDDEAPICVVCDRSKEHRNHNVFPVEEAAQEYKEKAKIHLDSLRKKREELKDHTFYKGVWRQDYQRKLELEKTNIRSLFERMQSFLEEKQHHCLAQLEDLEKEMEKKEQKALTELSEEISQLNLLIMDMEEKCQQPASEFLQDIRNSLDRCEKNSMGYVVDISPKLEERLRIISQKIFALGDAADICKEELEEVLITDIGEQTFRTENALNTETSQPPPSQAPPSQPLPSQPPLTTHRISHCNQHGNLRTDPLTEYRLWQEFLQEWGKLGGTFATEPHKVIDLLEGLFNNYDPSYTDCEQLLNILLTKEERNRIWILEQQWAAAEAGRVRWDQSKDMNEQMGPRRDVSTPERRALLSADRRRLLTHLRQMAQKPPDFNKFFAIRQEPEEPPRQFWCRLMEKAKQYTTWDAEHPEYQRLLVSYFVNHCQKCIHKHFEKCVPGWPSLSIMVILRIANCVWNQKKEKELLMGQQQLKKKIALAMKEVREDMGRGAGYGRGGSDWGCGVLRDRGRGFRVGGIEGYKGHVGNQACFGCGQLGHFKRDCPFTVE